MNLKSRPFPWKRGNQKRRARVLNGQMGSSGLPRVPTPKGSVPGDTRADSICINACPPTVQLPKQRATGLPGKTSGVCTRLWIAGNGQSAIKIIIFHFESYSYEFKTDESEASDIDEVVGYYIMALHCYSNCAGTSDSLIYLKLFFSKDCQHR